MCVFIQHTLPGQNHSGTQCAVMDAAFRAPPAATWTSHLLLQGAVLEAPEVQLAAVVRGHLGGICEKGVQDKKTGQVEPVTCRVGGIPTAARGAAAMNRRCKP